MAERLRAYRPDDANAVAALWHRAGRAAYPYLPTWQAFGASDARAVFHEAIAAVCEIWLIERDGDVVAFLALQPGYVDRLYVDPALQRSGIGTRLLRHAKSLHPRGLSLHTHQANDAARAFYEKHGFRAVAFGTSPPPESAPDVAYRWDPGDGEAA